MSTSSKEHILHEGLVRVTKLREREYRDIVTLYGSKGEEISKNPYLRGKLDGLTLSQEVAQNTLTEAGKLP